MGWQDAGALPETQGGNGSLQGANPTFAVSAEEAKGKKVN